jgi:tetratricopeptide (TPR) repeat protein
LSIEAARITVLPRVKERETDMVEAEARALICGTSWAFQRLHKISEARIAADQSFSLARDVGLDRTLAFCLKCRGRLCRMEAEAMASGESRTSKLHESIGLLQEAVEKFGTLSDFGLDHPEVGDCYSLMGRTYLELRDSQAARSAIAQAYERIFDHSSKDYIDLLILNGDFEALRGDRQAAQRLYQQALDINPGGDLEISEMRARAHFQLAINYEADGDLQTAGAVYESAADIWSQLHDEEFAARAAWNRIRVQGLISKNALSVLTKETESMRVRVDAVRIHLERVKEAGRAVGRREEPPLNYWKQLIRLAKQRVASRADRIEAEW